MAIVAFSHRWREPQWTNGGVGRKGWGNAGKWSCSSAFNTRQRVESGLGQRQDWLLRVASLRATGAMRCE